MKAVVFGGTGFIGSHVVEQLHLAGHQVTAAAREGSNTTFLESLGVNVAKIDFSNPESIGHVIQGCEVVYNCTADARLHTQLTLDAEVEVNLTRRLVETAALHKALRFIQLSTIVIYDFETNEPIDESYISHPEYLTQKIALQREKVVQEVGKTTGIETIVLRPASTIGVRDQKSFFARLLSAHAIDKYPLMGNGAAAVSLVDTRDIGRAMVWLGTYQKPEHDNGIYLLKGFDTTWYQLKETVDRFMGRVAGTIDIPANLTEEQMIKFQLTPFAVKTITTNRLWNDKKIRSLGFDTKYTFTESVEDALWHIVGRNRQ